MRLLDADKLIEGRVENDPVRIAAECEPTAYDIEKVARQLTANTRCVYKVGEKLEIVGEFVINSSVAQSIVRKGE